MKQLSALLIASAFIGVIFTSANAFELQELSREQATLVCIRVAYMWEDNTEEAVSRFTPISDELIAIKATYAAKQLSNEEKIFVHRSLNPELFTNAPENVSVAVDIDSATRYFFGREVLVSQEIPNYAYIPENQSKVPLNIKIISIAPNFGHRMYVVADLLDDPVEEDSLNVIGRLDMIVEPNDDAPLGWSVITYELTPILPAPLDETVPDLQVKEETFLTID